MQNDHYLKRELDELIDSNESIFKFFQESLIDGLWIWDLENPEKKWTGPEFWESLGYELVEMPHKFPALREVINPDDLRLAREQVARHCEGEGQPLHQVIRFKHKDGSTVWHLCRGSLIRDESGKPVRILGALQDVTALKKDEEHLRTIGGIIESPNTMVLVTDLERKLVWANDAFWKFTGYSKDEMVGKKPGEILQGPHPDMELKRQMSEAFDAGKAFHCELLNFKKNGRKYWIDVSIQPVFDLNNKLSHFVAVQHDITERKDAERKLSYHNEQFELAAAQATEMAILADAASHAKSEFLANMNHEVRTPMNGIMGMTSLLLESDLTPLQRYQAEIINECAASLLTMMDNVLEVADLESAKLKLKLESFDLRALLHSCVESMLVLAEEKELALNLKVFDNVPKNVVSHPGRIRQILNNLLGNALKFTHKGEVHLSVEAAAKSTDPKTGEAREVELIFEVTDTGIGIPEEEIGNLFSPFSQVDSSTTRKHGGSGLGLAICRQSVELMGGSIEVESSIGAGSTFRFSIPVEAVGSVPINGLKESGEREEPVGDAEFYGPVILLAEDLSLNQMVVKELLGTLGMQVDVVTNGIDAVHAFSTLHYDLILMDLQMPKMDGFDATRAIRAIEKNQLLEGESPIPIVALTAMVRESDRKSCIAAGLNDFIAKPVHLGKLEKVVQKWLSRKQDGYMANAENRKHLKQEGSAAGSRIAGSGDGPVEAPSQSAPISIKTRGKIESECEELADGIEKTDPDRISTVVKRLIALSADQIDQNLAFSLAQLENAARFGQWDVSEFLLNKIKSCYSAISE